jgi:hypothetical protein
MCFSFLGCVEHVLNKSYVFSEINILHRIAMFCGLTLCLELRVKLLLQWFRGGKNEILTNFTTDLERLNQNCCSLRDEKGTVSLPAISMLTA